MKIRNLEISNVKLKGENSMPFVEVDKNNFKTAIEIIIKIPDGYQEVLKKAWGNAYTNPVDYAKAALKKNSDFLAVKFNLTEEDIKDGIDEYIEILKEIEKEASKPLIITGSENNEVDEIILPALIEALEKPAIVGSVNEKTYKKIIPHCKKHFVIARTPIDINLAKELNILISDLDFSLDKVLIDTTIGALGYGLDYAYSVIERIKQAAFDGDEYLNMPIIAFVGDEVWKTKETKSSDYDASWGKLEERPIIWEIATSGSIMSAGANIVVVRHPKTLSTLDKLISKG
jgi:acetyl-CoA decarbonylase/synthase complex subunit delta